MFLLVHTACDVCQMCRQKILPFHVSSKSAKSTFELVHFDIWGPFGTTSVHGHKYFLTILDDCTRHIWVVMMNNKSEASQKVKSLFLWLKDNLNVKSRKLEVIMGHNLC